MKFCHHHWTSNLMTGMLSGAEQSQVGPIELFIKAQNEMFSVWDLYFNVQNLLSLAFQSLGYKN